MMEAAAAHRLHHRPIVEPKPLPVGRIGIGIAAHQRSRPVIALDGREQQIAVADRRDGDAAPLIARPVGHDRRDRRRLRPRGIAPFASFGFGSERRRGGACRGGKGGEQTGQPGDHRPPGFPPLGRNADPGGSRSGA
jgi:hypothetical protein